MLSFGEETFCRTARSIISEQDARKCQNNSRRLSGKILQANFYISISATCD
jgi:hypothetical protein